MATDLSDTLSVEHVIKDNDDVRALMNSALVSLLTSFDSTTECFYTYLVQDQAPSAGTYRDTAIVLTAVENVAKDLMDFADKNAPGDYAELNRELGRMLETGRFEQISYQRYRRSIFAKALATIAQGSASKILGRPSSAPNLFESRDAFSCARILELLNNYTREETHRAVWVESVAEVVGSLVQSRPPHFAFGGASMYPGGRADAFASYYCIASLLGIAKTLNQRAQEHRQFSRLLEDCVRWMRHARDVRLVYPDKESYFAYLKPELESLKEAVGIRGMVQAFLVYLKGLEKPRSAAEPKVKQVHECLRNSCRLEIINWLKQFQKRVEGKLDKLAHSIQNAGPDDGIAKRSGREWLKAGRESMRRAGMAWQLAFFSGMPQVLEDIIKIYAKPSNTKSLDSLAKAIGSAGERWAESERVTRKFINLFAQWGLSELQRQITMYAAPLQGNVDPVQLAFSLRIVHDLQGGTNEHLIAKGLEILAETQIPDGTWPIGVPLMFDPLDESAVHVVNLEIANAVVSVIQASRDGFQRHYTLLKRVHNWLKVNRRQVTPKGFSHSVEGWTSDKIFDRKRVDVWVTGLALDFLNSYQKLLQNYVNTETVRGKYENARPRGPVWRQLIDPALTRQYSDRITTKIFESYVRTFDETGESRSSAMVLYGPPGTGKTTYADAIAKHLNWLRVTITPSDFVKEGLEKSEMMARTLFQDLLRLRETVVLFDEIDEMLRSRSSEKPSQIAMLQFLIPGMLPKLQGLKQHGEKKGLIFIIATNYKERLDPAIVRTGRIDDHFAVYPPDSPSRCCILHRMLRDHGIPGVKGIEDAEILAEVTQGWVYKELENLAVLLNRQKIDAIKDNNPKVVTAPDPKEPWKGREVLKLQRGLDWKKLYSGRSDAFEEARDVLRICWPGKDKITGVDPALDKLTNDVIRATTT